MWPPAEPVAVIDRVLGLDDTARQRGHDPGGLPAVAVGQHGCVLEVPVLGLLVGTVRLLELGLTRAVGDAAVAVDGVPRADEPLFLAPLGVDDRLDSVGDGDEHGLLHHAVRQERLGLGLVELDGDLQRRCVHC